MTSIKETVDRLRSNGNDLIEPGASLGEDYCGALMLEAADLLERLAGALDDLVQGLDEAGLPGMFEIEEEMKAARAALSQKD
ncbi:MAG: hypothetical protein BVN33_14845 [Proteobacteria bacterium ST_bin13]|nr:MAG: hypothetical protein BVN33_14845 [Proteobacteria bacterium ST_bin13]